jgi:hypothetical protein
MEFFVFLMILTSILKALLPHIHTFVPAAGHEVGIPERRPLPFFSAAGILLPVRKV